MPEISYSTCYQEYGNFKTECIMKKILSELKNVSKYCLRYRLIITNDIIELKLTPKSNSEDEINFVVDNDKEGKLTLYYGLQKISYENKS